MIKCVFAAALLIAANHVSADGEVLLLSVSGTAYCNGSLPIKFTPKNGPAQWIRINNVNSATLALDPNMNTPIAQLSMQLTPINNKSMAFVAAETIDDNNYLSVVGSFKFDSLGYVKSLSASVHRAGLWGPGCFTLAKAKGNRIN